MNNKVINRLTYKSRRNAKMVFEIGFKKGEQVYLINTLHLLSIDSPNLIECKVLKVFRDVVLVQNSVMLRKETFEQVFKFFINFENGKLTPNTNYKGFIPYSL